MKNLSYPSIKAVSFDAAGTLFRAFPSVGYHYALEAKRFGVVVDPEIVEIRFRNVFNARGGLAALGEHSSEEAERKWWRETVLSVFKGFQTPKPFEDFFKALYVRFSSKEPWQLFPDVLGTLKKLRGMNKELAVVSNWDSRLFNVLKELGIHSYFRTVIISAKAGATKPHAAIFNQLKRELSLEAGQILHVGDDYECDVEGAQAAGLRSIHLNRNTGYRSDQDEQVIRSLNDLPALLLSE